MLDNMAIEEIHGLWYLKVGVELDLRCSWS